MAGKKICVVEDEPLVCLLVCDLLESLDYVTFKAASPNEAIAHFQKNADIDLLITDIGLPGMDGYALAAELRKINPDLPVLFATGYASPKSAELQFKLADTIEKPFDLDVLSRKVERLLELSAA